MSNAKRLALVSATVAAAAIAAEAAFGAVFFLFDSTSAKPGDEVVVRQGSTPVAYDPSHAARPLQRPIRVYLAPRQVLASVRSRFDRRLHFIGTIAPDKNGHGLMRFTVPPLSAGAYAVASWCPGCAHFSSGRTFFLQRPSDSTQRYRDRMLLTISTPPATATSCPVTIPNGRAPSAARTFHGNGLLAAFVPDDGVYTDPDGALSTKTIWVARGPRRPLTVRYQRIDIRSPAVSAETVPGTLAGYDGPSWASRMHYREGCWKVSGRVGDVALTFVVEVERG